MNEMRIYPSFLNLIYVTSIPPYRISIHILFPQERNNKKLPAREFFVHYYVNAWTTAAHGVLF